MWNGGLSYLEYSKDGKGKQEARYIGFLTKAHYLLLFY